MKNNQYWSAGQVVLFRGVWRDRLWWAIPVTVVKDTSELIALYWRSGTPKKVPKIRLSAKELASDEPAELVDKAWTQTDVLMLNPPGSAYSVDVMWEEGHTQLRCWYVNLQDPLCRTPLGFDSMDQFLDIVISSDLTGWSWKDEDEFADAVDQGIYSHEEAQPSDMWGRV